ncbi:MAG: xylanase [Chloroflexi bacterium]|nr:xylanase [Chloroflexota bacterium]|tara:strand:- start:2620 stop:3447 length:828 start_codon:yes stop_codon:yes gene_type:complete
MNKNLLGIDFEDWFHPELIKKYLKDEKLEPKVVNGLDKILELLRKNETNATFFVVGELLEFKPEILDKILENDHEIGFHTMHHLRLHDFNSKDEFSNELKQFSKLTNNKSKGFRAPTFSLDSSTSWAIDSLVENNYRYDSSIVPAKSSMYGHPDAQENPYRISSKSIENSDENGILIEYPLLVTKFLGKKIPAGGGFYLRTLPMKVIKNAIKDYEKKEIPATFYIHSWELTPEFMPKIKLSKKDNFITYHNIEKAYGKMDELLQTFDFTSFSSHL